jgi:hypothetical protein
MYLKKMKEVIMSKDLCGYFGKQLRISLDTKETSVEEIKSAVLKKQAWRK